MKALNAEIQQVNPTFLIMDIEGGEYEVFKHIDFHNIRKMALELHIDILGEARIAEIRMIIQKAGFKVDPSLSFHIPQVKDIVFVERLKP